MPKVFSRRLFLRRAPAVSAALAAVAGLRGRAWAAPPAERVGAAKAEKTGGIEEAAAEFVRSGRLPKGMLLVRDPAREFGKRHLDEILRSSSVFVVDGGGARKTSFEELMRQDLQNPLTEFIGWAAVARSAAGTHLIVEDHSQHSVEKVRKEVDALEELKRGNSGKAMAASAEVLLGFVKQREEAGQHGAAVHEFFRHHLERVRSGNYAKNSSSVKPSELAEWFARTYLDMRSDAGEAPQAFGDNPIRVHLHHGPHEPSKHDFELKDKPQLIAANHGSHARVYFVHGGATRFFREAKFGRPVGQRNVSFPATAEILSEQPRVYWGARFSPNSSVSPQHVFFESGGKWVRAESSKSGRDLVAKFPSPVSAGQLGKARFVVVDSAGLVTGNAE